MAKAMDISKSTVRATIAVGMGPYYRRVRAGQYVGVRIGECTGVRTESWWARYRKDGKQHYEQLGEFPDADPAKRYDLAVEKADKWFEQCGVGILKAWDVAQACREYVAFLKRTKAKPEDRIRQMERGFERDVYGRTRTKVDDAGKPQTVVVIAPDAIASVPANKVDGLVAGEWLERLTGRGIANSTVNRIRADFGAALTHAFSKKQTVGTAWRGAKRFKEKQVDGGKYLEAAERAKLISAATGALHDFAMAMWCFGARPIELLRVKREDFARGKLRLWSYKGRNAELRERWVAVPAEMDAILARLALARKPGELLFVQDNGKPWTKRRGNVSGAFSKLAKSIGIAALLYDLRHSRIAALLQSGVNLQFVAKFTGTSLQMMDKTYSKYLAGDAAELDRVRIAG